MLPQDTLVLHPVSEAVVHAEVAGQLEGVPVLVALDPALQAVAEVLEGTVWLHLVPPYRGKFVR